MKKQAAKRFLALCALAALATGACTYDFTGLRTESAHRLAAPAFMMERTIPAGPFLMTAYERVRRTGENATVYIEGDGLAWLSRQEPSLDPTPTNPVALHLATRDQSPNVIYLARPCQYSRMIDKSACDQAYWTGKRFAPEAIEAMNVVLDDMKKRYHIPGFHLVGYSGGGAMAVFLAARRHDVLDLRTVAGNLDTNLFSEIHKISPLTGSLNPTSVAARTVNIPQHHFIGKWDSVVTPPLYESFRKATGPSTCIRATVIDVTDHNSGWTEKWPLMLKEPLDCNVTEDQG
jgi:hypothetical protein